MGVILENMIGSTDKYEQNANTVSPSSHRKMYSLHILCSPMICKPSKWPPGRPRGGRKNLRLPWLAVRICGISGDLSGGCRVDPSYPVVGNQKRLSADVRQGLTLYIEYISNIRIWLIVQNEKLSFSNQDLKRFSYKFWGEWWVKSLVFKKIYYLDWGIESQINCSCLSKRFIT